MALIPTERALCNKIVGDFSGLTSPIRLAKLGVRQKAAEFEDQMRNTVFSATSVLDDALQSFEDQLQNILPGDTASDVKAIKDMIDNCDYLSALNPVSAVAGTALGIYGGIADIISGLSNTIPEFSGGRLSDSINNVLKGLQFPFGDDISNLFSKADKLIECLAAYCGGEYPAQVSQFTNDMNSLYSDMNIVSDPNNANYTNFDYNQIYGNVGMNPSQITNMTRTISTIDTGNVNAKSAIDSSIEAVKDVARQYGIGGL
jgi:hypothetical protein